MGPCQTRYSSHLSLAIPELRARRLESKRVCDFWAQGGQVRADGRASVGRRTRSGPPPLLRADTNSGTGIRNRDVPSRFRVSPIHGQLGTVYLTRYLVTYQEVPPGK